MKIYAPVKDANGVYASVRFVNGVGETDNPHLISWFESHGYGVEKCEKSPEIHVEKCEKSVVVEEPETDTVEMMGYAEREPDFENMPPNELREWARANGLGGLIKNTRNREKLLDIIKNNKR